jgi:outer membrane protein TolC
MSRHIPLVQIAIVLTLAVLAGCQPQQPFYFKQVDGDLAHYKGVATEIEYPDVESDRLDDVSQAQRPFSLTNTEKKETWDLTLEEAMRIALTNNKVMRSIGGQVQGPPDFLLRNPELIPTIYDPALSESNPRTGAEAALSAFDAQLSSSLLWERTDKPQNVNLLYSQFFSPVSEHDLSTFQARLSKVTATGGQFSLTHNVAYDMDRFNYPPPSRLAYPSDWNVNLVAEMRQPLLQGFGVQFNRIAGPGATPGLYNGVMLARINTDIALADFEASVRNLVSDVEVTYWELYFQYRSLDAVIAGRDSALSTWRKIYTLYRIGGKGGEAEKEAQAREQYYLFRSTAEQSLNALYSAEAKLRYLLGLAATDGRLIRPKDEPTVAKVVFDWCDVLNEGLVRSVELREQKWIVKRRELELIAAKNFLLPKLDFVGQYRWLGLGNDLFPENGANAGFLQPGSGAYESLTGGDFQEWQAGFQLNLPLGFRREMAGVRNAQLYVARERAKLQEGELELSHQLAHAIRQLEADHVLSQTGLNRRIAAQREVEAVAAAYETDTITLDVLLKAQQNLAQAESDFYRALVDYNKSIAQVHFRKGSLLEYNGVYLAEGPWPAKAYFDARRRARAREASTYLDYGFTQPRVISRGPIEQHVGGEVFEDGELQSDGASGQTPTPAKKPELVPTPTPESDRLDEIPAEPDAPQPVADPQASARGIGRSHDNRSGDGRSKNGRTDDGWAAVAKMPAVKGTVDRQVSAVGWASAENARSVHEPSTGLDRSGIKWKETER